ncbi:MAG: phage holin family protein [Ferruginibacter sp.]
MERQPHSIGSLFDNAGEYLETRLDLLKLQAVSKSSDVTSSIVSRVAILLVLIFTIFLLNMGLAYWIGEVLGKVYLGFFIVAGFYGLLALLLHIFRDAWLKEPVSTMIIKKMLN